MLSARDRWGLSRLDCSWGLGPLCGGLRGLGENLDVESGVTSLGEETDILGDPHSNGEGGVAS